MFEFPLSGSLTFSFPDQKLHGFLEQVEQIDLLVDDANLIRGRQVLFYPSADSVNFAKKVRAPPSPPNPARRSRHAPSAHRGPETPLEPRKVTQGQRHTQAKTKRTSLTLHISLLEASDLGLGRGSPTVCTEAHRSCCETNPQHTVLPCSIEPSTHTVIRPERLSCSDTASASVHTQRPSRAWQRPFGA